MGGFVLLHTAPGEDRSAAQAAALCAFARMGMPAPRLIRGENYILAVYPKRQASETALQQFPNGDFIFAGGTLIYENMVGKAAAAAFYRDRSGWSAPRDRAMGHYAVILRKGGVTEIVPDGWGGFLVFYDSARRIASSSFLAVASAVDQVTLGTQGACEYVFDGVVSGNATVFNEILIAPVNATIAVGEQRLEIRPHPLPVPTIFSAEPFEVMVEQSMDLLDRYFAAVAASFGGRVTCALSGGYDSRLILAMLRRHGISPRVYVYGPPGDKDVCLARAIAEGEGFALEVVDKDKQLTFAPSEFATAAYDNFLASDGYTWGGIFTNGAERAQRASRVSGNALALNGGGGEIWRNFFYLLDRTYSPREILWSFYSQFDPETCTSAFEQEAYFRQLEDKLEALIGCPRRSLPRPLVEWLYHYFRCRAWDGRINNINNTYGYVALPFLERPVTEHASVIPIGWKNHGAYEAELIRRADRRLAAYPSGYGHDFSRPPPLARRLADYGTYLRPPWLRRFAYRVKNRVRRAGEFPDYLHKEYRDAALPGGVRVMSGLFQLDRVADPAQMARILTLEYLARQFDGRIRVDFTRFSSPGYKKCAA
jgi:asparagine synthase (glutamine-hydrolysing)